MYIWQTLPYNKMTKDYFMKARYLNLFGTRNMCTVVPKVDWG